MKKYLILFAVTVFVVFGLFIYFRFFFTYEQRNRIERSIGSVTGQNLTVTVFDMNGKIFRKYTGVQKITSGEPNRGYVYFYAAGNKYVQIPDSVWYVAEEE